MHEEATATSRDVLAETEAYRRSIGLETAPDEFTVVEENQGTHDPGPLGRLIEPTLEWAGGLFGRFVKPYVDYVGGWSAQEAADARQAVERSKAQGTLAARRRVAAEVGLKDPTSQIGDEFSKLEGELTEKGTRTALREGANAGAVILARGGLRVTTGVANNIKGNAWENIAESAARREGMMPFFRTKRRGGIDMGLLDDGTVLLREEKFANNLQFDDFTAITRNLESNIAEVRAELMKAPGLTRADKALIDQTLSEALAGRVPPNLRIQVHTGKAGVGTRLQGRLQRSTGGIPVDFIEAKPRE